MLTLLRLDKLCLQLKGRIIATVNKAMPHGQPSIVWWPSSVKNNLSSTITKLEVQYFANGSAIGLLIT